MSPSDLLKFYERSWKDLLDFWNVFRFDQWIDLAVLDNKVTKWKVFEEISYVNRVSRDQVIKYQNILTRRILEIEQVIDKQFNTILEEIRQNFIDKFENERKRQKKLGLIKTLE